VDLQQLMLKIGGDSTGAESALGRVGNATNKMGSIVKSIIAGAAVAAMVKWTETTINLGVQAEVAGNLLEGTMKRTLGATNEQVAACKAWAENQEKVNHFDAELLMSQLDKAIVKYGDLGTAQIAVSAAQEVARWKNMDVAAAYDQVSQASNGMARSLALYGIDVVKGTSQLSYLQQILEKAKGSTDDYNKSTAGLKGAFAQFYEVIREQLGQALLPMINALATGMVPVLQHIQDFITAHKDDIAAMVQKISDKISDLCDWLATVNLESVFSWLGKIAGAAGMLLVVSSIASVIGKVSDLAGALTALAANPAFWVLAAGVGIVAGAAAVIKWGQSSEVANARNTVGQILGITPVNGAIDMSVANPQYGTKSPPIGGNRTLMRGAAPDASDISKGVVADIITTIGTVPPVIDTVTTAGTDAAKKIADAAKAAAQKAADAAKAAADAIKVARQSISDKIYTLTHTDQQNEQRALDVEYAANLLSSKDKLASKTLYNVECKALLDKYADIAKTAEEEQTAKVQTELDKRLAAQQRYNDAVANATKSLTDQIYAWTHTAQQKEASDIAMQAATAFASGVAPATINKYVSAATSNMYSEAGPAGTSSGAFAAVGQYLSGPLKKIGDNLDVLIGVTAGVAGGVGKALNGIAIP